LNVFDIERDATLEYTVRGTPQQTKTKKIFAHLDGSSFRKGKKGTIETSEKRLVLGSAA
jgi:hypothetical protein